MVSVCARRVGSLEALWALHEWETEARSLVGGQRERDTLSLWKELLPLGGAATWSWVCLTLDSGPRGPVALACGLSWHPHLSKSPEIGSASFQFQEEHSGHTWL